MRHSPLFQHGGDREPRNPSHITLEKPDGMKRIVILGDSLTFGDGVKATETYPFKLQKKLNEHGNDQFKVLNLGIMGINTDQEAMILTQENPYFGYPALFFEPDLLILTFCVNDLELMPDPKPRPGTLFLPKPIHKYFTRKFKLYYFIHVKLNQLLAILGMQDSYSEYLQKIYLHDTHEWKLFQDYLNFIIKVARHQKIEMLLVIFPSINKLDDSHPFLDLYSEITAIGRTYGIEVLDLFPYFKGKKPYSVRVSFYNGHPNDQAYEIASEAMYTTIVEKKMLAE
jgi:hypothetical protein